MENQKNNFSKFSSWIKNSIIFKLFTIGFLILILLFPIENIKSIIRERENRNAEVIREISYKWGMDQTIKALVLTIPYEVFTKSYTNIDKTEFVISKELHQAHFLPEKLDIKGDVSPESRYRGLYYAVVYKSILNINGYFKHPDFSDWKLSEDQSRVIKWDEAYLSFGVSDLKGIKNLDDFKWGDMKYNFEPLPASKKILGNGIGAEVVIESSDSTDTSYPFSISLNLNGSSSLNFIPLGKVTDVHISSNWKNPSFSGMILPDIRDVRDDGFDAKWNVLEVNRPLPQKYVDTIDGINGTAFGVSLLVPVEEYQKSMRAVKYAILLIFLMFISFFFIQVLRKVKMHSLQYLLVGFALSLFYTLLVSISEHLSFNIAYGIAALATVSLIALYTRSVYKASMLWQIITGILMVLFVFIFCILQLQDYSLLMGSIGLFLILGIIMYLSRNVDWYALSWQKESKGEE